MINPDNPLAFLRGQYRGPGLSEWILGLAAGGLLASNLQNLYATEGVQTGNRYYFQNSFVMPLQVSSSIIDFLIIVAVALCLVWPGKKGTIELGMTVLCGLGAGVAWFELLKALSVRINAVYVLPDLPFRPINNCGIFGATIFCLYLLTTQRFSKKWFVDAGLKAAFAIGIPLIQVFAYNLIVQRTSR